MWEVIERAAENFDAVAGLKRRESVDVSLPRLGAAWSITGSVAIRNELKDHWPACADQLTPEIRYGQKMTENLYGSEARGKFEQRRIELNNRMAQIFSEVDLIITASNPDIAFNAEGPCRIPLAASLLALVTTVCVDDSCKYLWQPWHLGAGGFVDGLPVGMQIMARHFEEPLLLELALAVERTNPGHS
ncbi:hypothetical protein EMGBS4_13340 [Acidimicrobiaceae bacterium]|nr:hypothetical protein EMGBS4_13340 [Acidimicrobiaceae bacterium]